MKTNLLRYLRGTLPGSKTEFNKRVSVFLSCLALASLFWLLNAFSKVYKTSVSFPVSYINQPENYIVSNDLPAEITLRVEGYGYSLLGEKIRIDREPVTLDVSEISGGMEREENKLSYLKTSRLLDDIENQISDELSVLDIYPDTISLLLEKRKKALTEVQLRSRISFAPQYRLYDKIQLKPPVVEISGPASYIDTLKNIPTDSLVLEELDQNYTRTLNIDLPEEIKGVEAHPAQVIVNVPVDKFTESTAMVDVHAENLPDSLLLRTFPEKVEVVYIVPMSRFDQIGSGDFRAVVDYNDIRENVESKMKVHLPQKPEIIQVKRIKPQRVEYILKSK